MNLRMLIKGYALEMENLRSPLGINLNSLGRYVAISLWSLGERYKLARETNVEVLPWEWYLKPLD